MSERVSSVNSYQPACMQGGTADIDKERVVVLFLEASKKDRKKGYI